MGWRNHGSSQLWPEDRRARKGFGSKEQQRFLETMANGRGRVRKSVKASSQHRREAAVAPGAAADSPEAEVPAVEAEPDNEVPPEVNPPKSLDELLREYSDFCFWQLRWTIPIPTLREFADEYFPTLNDGEDKIWVPESIKTPLDINMENLGRSFPTDDVAVLENLRNSFQG